MLGGGAWSFLVGGVNCLVNSDNERDLNLLNRLREGFLRGELGSNIEFFSAGLNFVAIS